MQFRLLAVYLSIEINYSSQTKEGCQSRNSGIKSMKTSRHLSVSSVNGLQGSTSATQKFYFIKSNSGNHSGFNRHWQLLGESFNRKVLEQSMIDEGFGLSDDIVERNGRPYDLEDREYVVTNQMLKTGRFDYDGSIYMIVSGDDHDMFDGGHYGYLPSFMKSSEED